MKAVQDVFVITCWHAGSGEGAEGNDQIELTIGMPGEVITDISGQLSGSARRFLVVGGVKATAFSKARPAARDNAYDTLLERGCRIGVVFSVWLSVTDQIPVMSGYTRV